MIFKKYFLPYFSFVQMWFLLFVPVGLLLLPASYFDTGDSVCISVFLFDVECWGCGMTRAIMHLIHFEIKDAYYFNVLSFVVLPILFLMWAKIALRYIKYVRKEKTLMVSFFYRWKA